MVFSDKYVQVLPTFLSTVAVLLLSLGSYAQTTVADPDSGALKEPLSPFDPNAKTNPFMLKEPANVKTEVEYDPETGNYNYKQKLGDKLNYREPTYLTFDEYLEYSKSKSIGEYWGDIKAAEGEEEQEGGAKGFRPQINVDSEAFDRIFGGNTIDIRPSGSAELIFGINTSTTENPAIPQRQRSLTTFDFNEKIQLNVIGNIGDKLKITTNYNTEATFDFENQMKLEYTGYEDEIIQKIELGNVSLPLSSSLITGSQSLFGVKTQLKFGRLTVTSVYSQQRGKKSEIEVQGGAQVSEFEVKADQYEVNRHFFLAHFFRDQYEQTLANPVLLQTTVNITRIEVWVTNTNLSQQNTRSILAFQDLGEGGDNLYSFPGSQGFNVSDLVPNNDIAFNDQNDLYSRMTNNANVRGYVNSSSALNGLGMTPRFDYEKTDARMLTQNEYFVHPQLGYISLNQELQPNQMLSVAYQYTFNGQTYQVGEFSTDGITGSDAIYTKMLKSRELVTNVPMWDLMMKNVYNLGAYQVERNQFMLHIWYLNQETGVENIFIPEGRVDGVPLIQVLGLDRVNQQGNLVRDGVFDFLDNPRITINPQNGRVYFPVLEPFGSTLREAFRNEALANKYAFDSLYTNTQPNAQYNYPDKNRFTLRGSYQSSQGSEISLNALNVPEGSVVVTAGGQVLVENQDYTVDYTLGRVRIINESIMESGTPIKISLESNSLFAIQSKALFASRFDYEVNPNLILGGTFMNLTERPLTQKINIGDEPISNTMVGVDGTWSTESQLLTTLVDKIPLINTKEKSSVQVSGEYAQLIPGHSRAIGQNGTSYIDDFEGSQSVIDIRSQTVWSIASTPQGQPDLFPEASRFGELEFGYNRAKFAWYVIDPLFYRNSNITPDNIDGNDDIQNNHYMREVFETEVFPNKSQQALNFTNIPILDIAYYPEEVGPYNYDVDPGAYADGISESGTLNNPSSRWGGMMRRIDQNDFDAANIEFIQFWLMDPYAEVRSGEPMPGEWPDQTVGGKLYFNLGAVSEDILNDGLLTFENGLPITEAEASNITNDTLSKWGRSTISQIVVNAFDNDPESREFQDVGLDGLRDQEERNFFDDYLQRIEARYGTGSGAYISATEDPSHDNYHFFRGDDYDQQELNTLERYKLFNGLDGNSPSSEESASLNADGYPTTASTLPNMEDINRDYTMDESESYYQYEVDVNYNIFDPANVGRNYITDVLQTVSPKDNREVSWYQFKIPVQEFDRAVGNIQDFRSIRFMRVFMKGFEKPIYLRFARLELVRGEWRRYRESLATPGLNIPSEPKDDFTLAAVNIEENGERTPINYVIPPDIQREINIGTTNLQLLNEQSLAMNVCDLQDGDARAAYRNTDFDVRSYKKLKMFIHAESSDPDNPVQNGELTGFVRIGTDFDDNYYEYELPLKVTQDPGRDLNTDSYSDQILVWPIENNVEIKFSDLAAAKLERNTAILNGNTTADITKPYKYELVDGRAIYIKGNPNLSTLKTVMVGVRNPKAGTRGVEDDAQPKCAEIWFNELRLTDFDQRGGWAAIGRVTARLADFATFSASGRMSTPGWGSIEKKVSELQRETIQAFDASTTIELGKFLPESSGVKVPMYLGYSQEVSTPMFAPLDPDIEFNQTYLDATPNGDSVKQASQTFTERKSINFTNVRKERTGGGKPKVYDISNLTATYSYSELLMRDINTEFNRTTNYNGVLSYNYSTSPKNYKPFSKTKMFRRSRYLRLIKDFNFYLLPKTLGFNTSMQKYYNEQKTRNNTPGIAIDIPVYVDKNFNWNRTYNMAFDLTRSLKLEFSANNNSLIRETPGQVSKDQDLGGFFVDESDTTDSFFPSENYFTYQEYQDSLWRSIREFGLTTQYNHQTRVTYSIPFKKFPLTDFLNSNVAYSSTYTWQRAPLAVGDSLGHTIQNSADINLTNNIRMQNLYSKVPYLRKISRPARGGRNNRGRRPDPKAKSKDDKDKDKDKDDEKKFKPVEEAAKLLMSLKTINVTYNRSQGTLMPGYNKETTVLGSDYNPDASKTIAPGAGFIFGQQNNFGGDTLRFNEYAARNGWLVRNEFLATQFTQTFSERMNIRANLEPVKDMRVEISANRNRTRTNSEFWRYSDTLVNPFDGTDGWWQSESPLETGNYSVSVLTWRTAFVADDDNYLNDVYNEFLANRQEISAQLAAENPKSSGGHENEPGYSDGYGSTHSEVLIPAFLAAYTGRGTNKTKLDPFKILPAPNWRITYNGLSKIKLLQKYFKTVTLNHSYRSTMNLSQYVSNLEAGNRDQNTDFIPDLQINTITISEQFAPFFNVDVTWKNELITTIEYKKDRTMTLSMANSQMTEVDGSEFIIGMGYTINELKMDFIKFLKGKKNPLRLRTDIGFRTNRTVIRRFAENQNQPTAGQRIISIKFTGDYTISDRLNLRLFYDRIANNPFISNAFPTVNTNAGFSVRFTLSS